MTPQLRAELRHVLADTSWLDACTCSHVPLDSVFVKAGHTMPADALRAARLCPTRRAEVMWAYGRDIGFGYIAGLSAGQRSAMSLDEALDFIAADTAAARVEYERQ